MQGDALGTGIAHNRLRSALLLLQIQRAHIHLEYETRAHAGAIQDQFHSTIACAYCIGKLHPLNLSRHRSGAEADRQYQNKYLIINMFLTEFEIARDPVGSGVLGAFRLCTG